MTRDTPSALQLKLAIRCELMARRDRSPNAVECLLEGAAEEEKAGDFQGSVWLLLKCAEILSIDCEQERAWQVFEERVAPLIDQLEEDRRTIVKRNFSFVGIVLGRDTSFLQYYEAVDQTRSDDEGVRGLLAAEDASRKRQHFESLPALWRELNRAYVDGDWNLRRKAHSRLGWETLAAGWIGQATYHSINGGNQDSLKQLAEWIIKWRNPGLLDATLQYALSSNLCEHTHLTAKLVGYLADIIPELQMPAVMGYLLAAINRGSMTRHKEQQSIGCLDALRSLAFRYSTSGASLVASATLSHPFARTPGFGRKAVTRVVRSCIPRMGEQDWIALAGQVLPWAQEQRWDGDYEDVLDLLEAMAATNQSVKQYIADAIAPSGIATSDALLQARLSSFGRHTTRDQLESLIRRVADRLPGQIWAGHGQPPPLGLGGLGTVEEAAPDGSRARVVTFGGMLQLDVIAADIDLLDVAMLRPLIEPICQLIRNPLNVIVNRVELCRFLYSVRTAFDLEMAEQICDAIMPLAVGCIDRSSLDMHEDSTTSPFQVHGPSVGEQRAFVLQILALLKNAHPGLKVDLDPIISSAMLNVDAAVRSGACRSLAALPSTARSNVFSLLAALQDTDEAVCISAYDAVTYLLVSDLPVDLHPIIVAVAARGAMASAPALRYRVARLTKQLCKSEHTGTVRDQLDSILQLLRGDQNFSIRSVFEDSLEDGDCVEF